MDVVRTPEERFEGLPDYPWPSRRLDLDGLGLAYLDEGEGDPVLLLHGEPTWSFLWRKAIPLIAPVARVVAPDYLGFGRSDKPVERTWYSYDAHYGAIEQLVEQLDLGALTVVVHDWGGPIGLRLCVEHAERVARLVVTNTAIGGGRPPSETWLRFREAVRHIGTEISVSRLVQAGSATELSDEVLAAYDAPFPTPESKTGVVMFPELVPAEPDHPSTAPMRRVRDALRSWDKPTLVVWGGADSVLPSWLAQNFCELIPGAPEEPIVLDGAGHFLQEDRGEEVGGLIRDFVSR